MKFAYYFILITSIISCFGQDHTFKFVDNKDRNGYLKPAFLKQMVEIFHSDTFVETGTYDGKTSEKAAQIFKTVHTVELHPQLYIQAKNFLSHYDNVTVHHGNSADMLKKILPTIKNNIVLFLDAHYSGENTAMSFDNPNDGNAITAIQSELNGLLASGITDCVILIDDIRGFGTTINGKKYAGCWAYPSLQEICTTLLNINSSFGFALLGDMLLAYDKNKYHVQLSSVVQACTKSRLHDGTNLNYDDLLEVESIIGKASGSERTCIESLYDKMTNYGDPMFLHDLWYGLICMESGKYTEAHLAFSKVLSRTEHFDSKRNVVDNVIRYEHPRIYQYLERCRIP